MNLYECHYPEGEWICYVFAETRGKAKSLFNSFFDGEFVDVRIRYIGKSDAIETPSVVDRKSHKDYPAVLALCDGYVEEVTE